MISGKGNLVRILIRHAVILWGLLIYGPAQAADVLLVMGDSISAAYGMPREQGWVSLLEKRLAQELPGRVEVVNASVSGETTAGGLVRFPVLLQRHAPRWVVLELGANDALRGLPLAEMQDNLQKMITLSQQHGASVMLLGMRIPPNYGPRYTENFADSYRQLAVNGGLPLVPFLLEGVAGDPALMQADGLHPTAEAQPALLEHIWPVLLPVLQNAPKN